MRILILTKYGRLAASSRYRFLQFVPDLEKEGIEVVVSPLLSDRYLREKFRTGRTPLGHALIGFFRRLAVVLRAGRFDLAIVYAEGYPYIPGLVVKILEMHSVPYIYDYDDAVFHTYERHSWWIVRRLLGDEIRRLISGAASVFAGNRYLADYARESNPRVDVVPTVVSLAHYNRLREHSDRTPLVIGWIGSPSTARYLPLIARPLAEFCASGKARVVLVGSGPVRLNGVPVEIREWTEEKELDDLLDFDIGVMPLPDDDWARGKCGFKLIQYMACGIPVVASPVGANLDIVEEGQSGFFASAEKEWVESLQKLASSPELRERMGHAGRKHIEESYSKDAVLPTILRRVHEHGAPSLPRERNIDWKVVEGFGSEWSWFDQSSVTEEERREMFDYYFQIFPWEELPPDAVGFDLGCGSGRWAALVAPRVGELHCIDPSAEALEVARRNLHEFSNTRFHLAGVGDIPLPDDSADFGYSLGVLHHLPNPQAGLDACVAKLKRGAPFLLYLYYALENRPAWYRWTWRMTEPVRFLLSRSPRLIRFPVSQTIAATIYWPLARSARLLERIGMEVDNFPLAAYRDRSFYVMRTDALDRFGTRLERRFTRSEIERMMRRAGLEDITFSRSSYWCAVGYRR
ncbi:MAG TPA: methyltransferase domain-containing protein [Thermoanaerobaculia bacterium]|nr:methyltransferase domain-containing protein [Thermoanaerobaculia bacterium]